METHFGLHTLDGEWYALLPRYASLAQALVGRRVLEVGCGRGVGTALLHQAGVEKIAAIDHRPEHIQDAQARFDELDDETFNVMRYDDMEYEDALFDVIICLDTNFPATDKLFLAEVQRLLAPGGVFVAAFEVHEAYGLDKVLPRSGDAVEVAMTHMAASGAQRLLTERFGHTQTLAQIPELSFTFATDHEETQNWRQEALGLANKPVADSGAVLVLSSAQELDEDEPLLRATRVRLPHDAIVARLGRIQNDFFLQGEEAEQRLLVANELGEERLELINDLEEEVRSQRELVSDQTAQIDDFKEQLTAISQIPDLTSDFARAQAELAARKQETLELTADFNRRVQDLTWALEERDARLNELAQTNRQWEQYSQGLEQDLAARELALENLGKVLARFEGTQAPEAKPEPTPEPPPEAPAPQQTAQAPKPDEHQAQELRKALAINAALESEGQALRQQLADMRAHLKSAQQEALRAQESHHRLQAELHSRANYAAEVEHRAEAQDTQAKAFAQEVAGVYEEANTLKKSLEKAQEQIKSLDEKATKKADVSVNLERELYQKGQELLKLKRELMGKNVEVSGLERENVRLLKVKADADKAIDAERASVKTLEERLDALGKLLDQARAEAKDNAAKLAEAHKKAADAAKAQQKAQAALKKAQEEASKAPTKAPKALASTPRPKAPTKASQDAGKAKADASSPVDKPKAGGASSPSAPQAAPSDQKQGGASSPGDPAKANNTNTAAPPKGVQLSLDVDTPPAETKAPVKKPRRAKPAPKAAAAAKPKKADKAPKKAKADPKASKDGRPNEDDLKEAGFKLEGKGFWVSKDAVFVGTSRYWARVTLKPSKRVRVEGGAAKTTTVQLSKLVDVLTERFNVSERGARKLAQHLKTTGLGRP